MSGGDVEGFSAVAFPIVRRVFGELIANELVSVQPMSLPSGLIFFLDFTVNNAKLGYGTDQSLYGGGKVASEITGGVDLSNITAANLSEAGPYALNNGYAAATASVTVATTMVSSGTYHGPDVDPGDIADTTADAFRKALRYDPDIASGTHCAICTVPVATLRDAGVNMDNLVALSNDALATGRIARRLTRIDPDNTDNVIIVTTATGSETLTTMGTALNALNSLTLQ